MLRFRAVAVWLRGSGSGKVATNLIKYSHILTIYTLIERKIGTPQKCKIIFFIFKNCIFFNLNCYNKNFSRNRPHGSGPVKIGPAPQHSHQSNGSFSASVILLVFLLLQKNIFLSQFSYWPFSFFFRQDSSLSPFPPMFVTPTGSKDITGGTEDLSTRQLPSVFILCFVYHSYVQFSGSGWIRVFSPIRIRTLKTRIRPFFALV